MNTYYAVGTAMHTLEYGIFPFVANLRVLDAQLVLTESFDKKMITRVFLTYDDAHNYAETLERYPIKSVSTEHAPILTFTTERTFAEQDQKVEIESFNRWTNKQSKSFKYVSVKNGLSFNEITPTKLNFPTDRRVCSLYDFGAKKKMCLVM